MFKHVLFDLDGTLTDSQEGIIKSVEYALVKMGIDITGRLDPDVVVGPPLMHTFMETYGFSRKIAEKIYEYFQERYSTIGKFENRPYDGILDLLKLLHEQGIYSYLATSKPQIHAQAIVEKFGIFPYLSMISGSQLGGTEDKALMIKRILDSIDSRDEGTVVMVGDRKYDAIGAHNQHIPVILVEYGYGSEEECKASRPDYIAPSVAALTDILLMH